jgi:hypothetical protein
MSAALTLVEESGTTGARVNKREITFAEVEKRIQARTKPTPSHGRLAVAETPEPWVPPPLIVRDPGLATLSAPLDAEVILIEAPAAVGKSTAAARLSAEGSAPLLDLGQIPVSTGTLKFLISDLRVDQDSALSAFHAGELAIVIDALDEGRIRSGELGFESFIATAGELLLEDRSSPATPKLIFLGRPESTKLTRELLAFHASSVSWSSLEVGYFDETAARQMVDVYAQHSPRITNEYRKNPGPVGRVIDAYFEAIAQALGLVPAALWASDRGREFAGYAPVLAAVGTLLAEVRNFVNLENALLGMKGATQAWEVIAQVVQETAARERDKLCSKLPVSISSLPQAYDQSEQLSFLADRVGGRPLRPTKRVGLLGPDVAIYHDAVQRYLDDHPFLKTGEFANPVLASPVIAHGILEDLWTEADDELLAGAAKQPFLWRALSDRVSDESLLDGRYLGFALCSLWTDPTELRSRVVARSRHDDVIRVRVELSNRREIEFNVAAPVVLHARLGDCDIEIDDRVVLAGRTGPSGATLIVDGDAIIRTKEAEVQATTIAVDRSLWFEADRVSIDRRLELRVREGARVGWGGTVRDTYPWNRHPSTLEGPARQAGSRLEELLRECSVRLGAGETIALDNAYRVVDDDRLRWAARDFRDEFPELIRLLVRHELASSDTMGVQGSTPKVRVRFDVRWTELLSELKRASRSPGRIGEFIAEATARIAK